MSDEPLAWVINPLGGILRVGSETLYTPNIDPWKLAAHSWQIQIYRSRDCQSHRFIKCLTSYRDEVEPVAGLQIMSQKGMISVLANMYCHPDHRRMGYMRDLFKAARLVMGQFAISDDLSPDGKAFVQSLIAAGLAENRPIFL